MDALAGAHLFRFGPVGRLRHGRTLPAPSTRNKLAARRVAAGHRTPRKMHEIMENIGIFACFPLSIRLAGGPPAPRHSIRLPPAFQWPRSGFHGFQCWHPSRAPYAFLPRGRDLEIAPPRGLLGGAPLVVPSRVHGWRKGHLAAHSSFSLAAKRFSSLYCRFASPSKLFAHSASPRATSLPHSIRASPECSKRGTENGDTF